MNNNKKDINGFTSSKETFKGRIKKVVKAATAIALAAGVTITAVQAIESYNKWLDGRTNFRKFVRKLRKIRRHS